ncbi:MAG: prolyl oligopeptidase family serine peptidase [Gemmatimonadaceae bacterium]|nr:prolyl oligopeptidase family serine peptidase [Gemmatimonadaceae bacterium]MCW5826328.1 prolyl oligopeptidase family serine peptidase [Gemmatimonadaceae bacterium]
MRSLVLVAALLAAVPDTASAQRSQRYELRVGARTRSAEVRVPRAPAAAGAMRPRVIVLHGGGGNAENAERMTGFTALVEREGIVVAYPNGSARRERRELLLTWNARHCCGPAMEREVDDVGFLRALIDTLVATQAVDPRRVFVTGMSNGGMMSHVAALRLGDKVAAIAPVVGTLFGDEPPPAAPVRAIIFNGMRDESVPFDGGTPGGVGRGAWRRDARPSLEQGVYWARANGCGLEPQRDSVANVVTYRWPCPRGREVELHAVVDGGHAWPGGRSGRRVGADRVSSTPDATAMMWAFFARQ